MFLFSLASSRRLHQILSMYLFFTAMLVNVLVFAAPWPPEPLTKLTIRLGRRVGTNGHLLPNKIGFAPDQQFVIFIGDHHTFQYHPDTDKISIETDLVDFKLFPIASRFSPHDPDAPFIHLGTNHEEDIFINFSERETLAIETPCDTVHLYRLGEFLGFFQNVDELRASTGVRFTSDLMYVEAVLEALTRLVRGDGKTKLLELEPEDYQRWQNIIDVNWHLRGGVHRMLGAWDDQGRCRH
ncbi:hypothetical protein F5051DRAFT_409507 [Lentinula edodes]|nr:hypothetical protein F5051DRAFT_409507 [Lentinula edodes]